MNKNEIVTKGQLIFEKFFWCLQLFQKTNENHSTWGTIVVILGFFIVRFLEELKIPTRHFEINWPLDIILN